MSEGGAWVEGDGAGRAVDVPPAALAPALYIALFSSVRWLLVPGNKLEIKN